MKNSHEDSFVKDRKILSQSAPLFPQRKFEPAERIRQLRPSSSRKINSYVLPKPGDVSRISAGSQISVSQTQTRSNLNMHSENLYHSYPLQPNTYEKLVGTETLSGPIILNSKSVLKESNNNKMPPPLTESISMQLLKPQTTSSSKKLKLQSFSGPLASKPLLTKTLFSTGNPVNASGVPPFSSGPILRSSVHRSSSPSKISPTASPTFTSPRISELHELPRPPVHVIYGSGKPSGGVGFSAPLASRSPEITTTSKSSMAKKSSPLPAPPLVGYFSMPLSVAGTATKFPLSRASETSPGSEKSEDNFSPPATPMMFATRLSNIN